MCIAAGFLCESPCVEHSSVASSCQRRSFIRHASDFHPAANGYLVQLKGRSCWAAHTWEETDAALKSSGAHQKDSQE